MKPRFGIGLIALVVLGLVVLFGSVFTVNERELAVVLQFGEPVNSIVKPGLYFKIPMIQEVRRVPATRQLWQSRTQADVLKDLPTKDGKKIEVTGWAIWRVTDPQKFVRVLRTVENGEQAVKVRVRAVIRDVITSYKLSEVVRSTNRELTYSFRFEQPGDDNNAPKQPGEIEEITIGREKILDEIRARIQERLRGDAAGEDSADRGIELVDIGISDIGFVASVRQVSFDRLNAFMESIAAGYENEGVQRKQEIINKTQAEVERILGEGSQKSNEIRGQVDAEIIGMYAEAIEETGEFYNFIRTLEVYEKSLDSDTRLIMTTDSDIFGLLKSVDKTSFSTVKK